MASYPPPRRSGWVGKELVFGERRNLAVRGILKKKTMLARGCVQRGRETARNFRY
jgi:hypothetical protein